MHVDVGVGCALVFAASWWYQFDKPAPSTIVRTKGGPIGVKPPPVSNPCPRCKGTGKSPCGHCGGRGRLNFRETAVLKKGAHPHWCRSCMGSGRWHCERCMGTGVKRDKIGFRLKEPEAAD
ncbi:hypothetical protein BSKO_06602 [Bryopsis sp. KO-2023]|nr:hypothetical protein BSKO_06602 [Bryopsis sp. KO-2023]